MEISVPAISKLPDHKSLHSYTALWAKSEPEHPLWKHLLDAASVSLALHNPLAGDGWSPNETAFIVSLHDIGKADAKFQHQADFGERLIAAGFPAPTSLDTRCRHERISADFVKKKLTDAGLDTFNAGAIVRAVVAHHGYWDEGAREPAAPYIAAQEDLYQLLRSLLDVSALPVSPISDLSAFGMRLAGHLVLCDWIASNEGFFTDDRLTPLEDPVDYFSKAKEVARERVTKLGMNRRHSPVKSATVVENPRPLQKVLLENDIPPGLVIIEAPMGEGKTEAAWILAEKWRDSGIQGMYMALPTMATSDSLFFRYQNQYLDKLGYGKDAKLVHGMAWLRDREEPEEPPKVGEPGDDRDLAAAWFRPTRQAMLAAHGVGTVDQAMLAGMHVKFGFLRLYGLTGRALVIDEVHAYDAYMSAIIARLLQWSACLKIPVILLSATLSARQRATLLEAYGATGGDPGPEAPYPMVTVATPGAEVQTIPAETSAERTLHFQCHDGLLGDAKATAVLAQDLVMEGGCCCVILNTVKQAQAVYRALRIPAEQKLLFHARFTAEDREAIAKKVLKYYGKDTSQRPERFVLVATQVVEQSLDVDFDHMISEIAPIDLLLQRSGRLHRHRARDEDPVLHVLLPKEDGKKPHKFGASEVIYQRYPLLGTLALLKEYSEVRLPTMFRPLIEGVYGDEMSPDSSDALNEALQAWDDFKEDLAAQAGQFLLCEPMGDEFDPVGADEVGDDSDDGNGWRARTRLGLEDVLVIPVQSNELTRLKEGNLTSAQVVDLYKRSLKLPPHSWPPRPETGFDTPVLATGKLKGAWLFPIAAKDGVWTWSGTFKQKPYNIKYDPDQGLTHGKDI